MPFDDFGMRSLKALFFDIQRTFDAGKCGFFTLGGSCEKSPFKNIGISFANMPIHGPHLWPPSPVEATVG